MDPTGPDIKDDLLEAQIKQELDDLIADDFKNVPYDQESSDEDFDNYDDSDSDYEWQSNSRPKRTPLTRRSNIIKKELSENYDDNEANDAKSRLPCQGCQRTFLSKANLNKHIGQNRKCKRFYENQGILPPELIAHEKRKSQLKGILLKYANFIPSKSGHFRNFLLLTFSVKSFSRNHRSQNYLLNTF